MSELQSGFYWGVNIFGDTVPFSILTGTYCQVLKAGSISASDVSYIKDSYDGRNYTKEEIKNKSWYKHSGQGYRTNIYTEIIK